MTYLMTTHGAGDPETFLKVNDKVFPHADGLLAVFAGTTDQGMAITTVWETKAHSDRFTVETLLPALTEVLGTTPIGPPSGLLEFETFYEHQAVRA